MLLADGMPEQLLLQRLVNGRVFLIPKDKIEHVVLKNGDDQAANKYYIFLGLSSSNGTCAGVIINSRINSFLHQDRRDLQMPLKVGLDHPFLCHDSFVDCSCLFIVKTSDILRQKCVGSISQDVLSDVMNTVSSSKFIKTKDLKEHGII